MRQHSIKATLLIHKTLVDDTEFIKLIPENSIWPVVVKEDQKYPYMVIKRDSIQPDRGNKDFWPDIITFSLEVYSSNYNETVEIADAARFLLEGKIIQDENLRLEHIELNGSAEDFVQDAYVQTMGFKANVLKPRIVTN